MRQEDMEKLGIVHREIRASDACRIYCDGIRHAIAFDHAPDAGARVIGKCDGKRCKRFHSLSSATSEVPPTVAKVLGTVSVVPKGLVLLQHIRGRYNENDYYVAHNAGSEVTTKTFEDGFVLKSGEHRSVTHVYAPSGYDTGPSRWPKVFVNRGGKAFEYDPKEWTKLQRRGKKRARV